MTGTTRFDSAQEYRQWVEGVARNALNRDPSPADFIAPKLIVDLVDVNDDELAMYFSAEPYLDPDQERLYPKDVIAMYSSDDWPSTADSVRDLAVKLLAGELESAMRELRQEGGEW